jgi:protein SCO1/2
MLGTVLSSSNPAPDFELTDQFGQPAALSSYSGKVVVLTFLYTYCPDICPIVTSHLRDAHEMLGDVAGDVAFVAVSVDPARDTVEQAHAYSIRWQMLDRWAFLVGDEEALSAVWGDYYFEPSVDGQSNGDAEASHKSHDGGGDGLRQEVEARYTVSHSAPVYLIDGEGRMRVVFTPPLEPEDIVHDILLLLD